MSSRARYEWRFFWVGCIYKQCRLGNYRWSDLDLELGFRGIINSAVISPSTVCGSWNPGLASHSCSVTLYTLTPLIFTL